MSTLKELRDSLVNDSDFTNLVPSSNIKVGFLRERSEFPCITITQAGGGETGFLGYSTTESGSRVAKEEATFAIDIYSDNNVKENLDIYEQLRERMLNEGYIKMSDIDLWEEGVEAWRKSTSWKTVRFHED